MVNVRVKDYRSGKTIVLTPEQTKLFMSELVRVKKPKQASKGVIPDLSSDCTIFITQGINNTEYELYARAVLLDIKANKSWQFYFGLLLMEWLHEDP